MQTSVDQKNQFSLKLCIYLGNEYQNLLKYPSNQNEDNTAAYESRSLI